ncbi:glycosyltransferase family 39 protein [Thiohalobacter sp. IOR34]|uniref:ArnT family glycosyltransferase n=1 Tax=Thiohalobacter sp. IOR34 TaxID=3057176 RepID=UPI0025B03045|nr:glycosyltransferase family 39 protein [Thiohalobacter sp. IOR34]WJW75890.1 glycosyltransferase family 39 protein [Thiohalobacter sp. IOR34]
MTPPAPHNPPWSWPALAALWLLVVVTALLLRPLLPVDETRYVSVAWEMWLRGDFLVPHLNGQTYAHKPPLLFWLMQAGWALFGVNDWWPRLVAPLVALANLWLTASLARRLWPRQPAIAAQAPWLLFAILLWTGFQTLTQFDMLIVFCTLLGLLGLLQAGQGEARGWWLFGLAIGLGILAKGPVILLHLLPAALAGPWWAPRPAGGSWRWYRGLGAGVLLGAAIGLAWAVPAGIAGGEAYRHAIFWGQTANRVVNSFAHRQPWWWYLPLLPLMLLPWSLWPRLWRRGAAALAGEGWALRFLLAWLLPVFIAFSLVSGKQVKYLLPLFPGLALYAAWRLDRLPAPAREPRAWLGPAMLLALAAALFLAPSLLHPERAPWLAEISPLWGLAPLLLAVALAGVRPRSQLQSLALTATASALVIVVLHLAVLRVAAPAYDLRPLAGRIHALQAAGRPVAHVGKYHGQFQFLGRLRRPLAVVPEWEALDWARAHPDGYLVLYNSDWKGPKQGAEYVQDYRGQADDLALWSASALLAAAERAP